MPLVVCKFDNFLNVLFGGTVVTSVACTVSSVCCKLVDLPCMRGE